MSKKLYVRRDGNGGLTISIPLALVAFAFTVLMVIVSASASYGALDNRVKSLENYFASAGPEHTQIIKDIQTDISALDKENAAVSAKLDAIQSDIQEIKADVKEVKTDLKNHAEGD